MEPKIESGREVRDLFGVEFRLTNGEAGTKKLEGHAATYNQKSQPIGMFFAFREIILPGAFDKSVNRGDDVRMLWNHNPENILARTKAGTLKLWTDTRGLAFEVPKVPASAVREIEAIERGDVSQMSFGFQIVTENWRTENKEEIRELVQVYLFDVSPATFPAYDKGTDIQARAMLERASRTAEERFKAEASRIASAGKRLSEIRMLEIELL